MKKSIFNKVINRRLRIGEILDKIIQDAKNEIPLCDYPELDKIDKNKICIEIDQFAKEFPDTYQKYLFELLDEYLSLKRLKNKYIEEFLPEKNEKISDFFWTIDYIVDHLQFVLEVERERFTDLIDRFNTENERAHFKNYRELVYLIKSVDLKKDIDYDYSERLLNKAIGELMILTPSQQKTVLNELNGIYANIQTFYKKYWIPENFDLTNDFEVVLYKRFLSESFFIKWPKSLNQLDLNTLHIIVTRVKFNSTILNKIMKSVQPTQKKVNSLTFQALFRDNENAQKVKDLLELKGYTIDGIWQGLTKKKNELLTAYYVLQPLLKPDKVTPQAKIFYSEFGLPDNYISNRSLTKEPFNQNRAEFEKIFSHLIEK